MYETGVTEFLDCLSDFFVSGCKRTVSTQLLSALSFIERSGVVPATVRISADIRVISVVDGMVFSPSVQRLIIEVYHCAVIKIFYGGWRTESRRYAPYKCCKTINIEKLYLS